MALQKRNEIIFYIENNGFGINTKRKRQPNQATFGDSNFYYENWLRKNPDE